MSTANKSINLCSRSDVLMTRSQAKKVLEGLDKFKKIIFDFKGIKLIGQGFADEIFRVWQNSHPNIILEPINMNESVEFMINRAKNTVVD